MEAGLLLAGRFVAGPGPRHDVGMGGAGVNVSRVGNVKWDGEWWIVGT